MLALSPVPRISAGTPPEIDSDSSCASSSSLEEPLLLSIYAHLRPASQRVPPSRKRVCPSSKPPKCWTVFGSPRDSWVVDIDGWMNRIARDKFGFTVEEDTFVITNAFCSGRRRFRRRVGQVVCLSGLSEGHGCRLHMMDDSIKTDLCNVVSCRAVAHFVSLWMRTIHRRLISRVLVLSWHAKLPTCSTQLIYEFVDWTKKNIDDIVSIFYDGSPASWHRCRFVIPCHKCRIWKEEMKRHPRSSSLIQSEWDPPCRYDTTTV